MFTAGTSQGQVLSDVQIAFVALREAVQRAVELANWSAGVQQADLVNLGFTAADATAILSAVTEAQQTVTTYNANATFQRQVMGSHA